MSFNKQSIRICDHCGQEMHEEYMEMYDNREGATCYTEWYDELLQRNFDITKLDNV